MESSGCGAIPTRNVKACFRPQPRCFCHRTGGVHQRPGHHVDARPVRTGSGERGSHLPEDDEVPSTYERVALNPQGRGCGHHGRAVDDQRRQTTGGKGGCQCNRARYAWRPRQGHTRGRRGVRPASGAEGTHGCIPLSGCSGRRCHNRSGRHVGEEIHDERGLVKQEGPTTPIRCRAFSC